MVNFIGAEEVSEVTYTYHCRRCSKMVEIKRWRQPNDWVSISIRSDTQHDHDADLCGDCASVLVDWLDGAGLESTG